MISILMSNFNMEQYLSQSIASILTQTLSDFRLLIVDDGSADNSLKIIHAYAAKDPRIMVVASPHIGRVAALQKGLSMIQTEWCAILDADDIAIPTRLERQLTYLQRHPELSAVGSACWEINASAKIVRQIAYPATHAALLHHVERGKSFPPHSSLAFRTEFAQRVGGYNKNFSSSMDRDFLFRLAEYGKIACLSEPLVKVRRHPHSISAESGGRPQQVTGMAATICHFLRKWDKPDISQAPPEKWQTFLAWLETEMEKAGWFTDQITWRKLRNYLVQPAATAADYFDVIKTAAAHPCTCARMFLRHYYGSRLPLTLAQKYLKNGNRISLADGERDK